MISKKNQRWGVICVFLIFFSAWMVDGQFNKYSAPNDVDYINCTLSNGFPKSYCPVGTYCVSSILAMGVWYPGMSVEQTVMSELTSPGCCAEETSPCLSPSLPFNVPGCCPDGQQCCFSRSNTNKFLGCVDIVQQCCGDTICPKDYSCCYQDSTSLYYCCPDPFGCSISINATYVNNTPSEITRVPNAYFPGSDPLTQIRPQSMCMMPIDNGTNHVPWPANEIVECGKYGNVCYNETEDCYSKSGINLSLNVDNNATTMLNEGMFCCSKNSTVCMMSERKNQQTIIGCADTENGESCCGSQICPYKSKCCHFAPPNDGLWSTNTLFDIVGSNISRIPNPYNESAVIYPNTDICCPEGTYCCAILLNPDRSMKLTHRRIFGFCGRNEYCTSIATLSETIQPIPSFGGFLPDYVENAETIINQNFWQNPIDRFSEEYNFLQNCNNCNAFSETPTSCKTSCQDQCGLDITSSFN